MWIFLSQHRLRFDYNGVDGTHVSARTIRVRLVFSIVNFVLPS